MSKLIAITLLALVVYCEARPPVHWTTLPLFTSLRLSDANNRLGLSLMKNLNDDNKENVFFSPLSLSTALAMLYSGAKGTTAEEMRGVLGYESENLMDSDVYQQFPEVLKSFRNMAMKNKQNSMTVANKMLVQKGFDVLEDYKKNIRANFDSPVDEVDFSDDAITQKINDWVRSETNDKIKKLLDRPLDPNTKLVLLNAIYFKGVFQTKFDDKLTEDDMFFVDNYQQITTKMMRRKGKFNFTEIPELDSSMIEIPYSGHDISLFVVLPNDRQGIRRLNKEINDWSQMESAIHKLQETNVEVTLPKFRIETSYSLKDKLSEMGMSSVFTSNADLSGIDGRKDLEVGQVMHKAFVEVNEEGTEAAAVTGIDVHPMAIPLPMIPVFRADHPFMFFIRDNVNRMNLFVGQVNQL